MRTCQRNKRKIYYALYIGKTDQVDSDGNYTGDKVLTYSSPVEARMNVSGGRGQAEVEMFGVDNPFTHTAATDDLTTEFSPDTIFWFGVDPTTHSYNFRCTGISRTINQVVIALEEVSVSHPIIISA